MRLNQYLVQNQVSASKFAKELGVSSVAVWKWLNGVGLPAGKHMVEIHKVTDGKVTSADWEPVDGQTQQR